MDIGMIGLGRMGGNMAERLLRGGHRVVAYNRSPEKTRDLAAKGADPAFSLSELVQKLPAPRALWIMVPAGAPTQQMIDDLVPLLTPGDLLIDGGNTRYTDSIRRSAELKEKGLRFMDAGTSGGIWGLTVGYCLMTGGEAEDFRRMEPALATLAPPKGYLHCGPAGSGHFTKMVHNGIEYGMMQAYAEGFEIMKAAPFPLDLHKTAALWNQGSVVRSWLLELAERAFAKDADLSAIRGYVDDSGEGRWTIQQAIDTNVPAPVITLSLFARLASRQPESFAAKVLAALRNEFGGHAVRKAE